MLMLCCCTLNKIWKESEGEEDRQRNKRNPAVGGSSGIEASIYHHIIDRY